jgi:hypothetical protein|tara:strand:+ start:42 stop:152 length:111 start_codon:yes stop_codon:yes gene_type:complete
MPKKTIGYGKHTIDNLDIKEVEKVIKDIKKFITRKL